MPELFQFAIEPSDLLFPGKIVDLTCEPGYLVFFGQLFKTVLDFANCVSQGQEPSHKTEKYQQGGKHLKTDLIHLHLVLPRGLRELGTLATRA